MPNIEELLRKAMEEGKFDNAWQGKALHLDENNPCRSDWDLAYHIIKESGIPCHDETHEIENDSMLPAGSYNAWKAANLYFQ
jgi:hypothetical protein